MPPQEFIEKLLSISDQDARLSYLRDHFREVESEGVVRCLLDRVIRYMRAEVSLSVQLAELMIEFGILTGNELHRAVGLRAKAQAMGNGSGNYQEAIPLFEEAISIHRFYEDEYGEALVCITYIWSLAHVGRYPEAIQRGEWAVRILQGGREKGKLANLVNNLGLVHNRIGNYQAGYEKFSYAELLYYELGGDWLEALPNTLNNKALALYNLGQFRNASEAAVQAIAWAEKFDQREVLARSQHTLGMIKFIQGKYNESLQLFDQAQKGHEKLGQKHEVGFCKLSMTDCLLELRQFKKVVSLCDELKRRFQELNLRIELGETIRNQASAWTGMKRYGKAIQVLEEARQVFVQENHELRVAFVDLQKAICFREQRQYTDCVQTALECERIFARHELPLDTSAARLLAAWGLTMMGKLAEANNLVDEVLKTIQSRQWPLVWYQVYHLQGYLAKLNGQNAEALNFLSKAVEELERLRSNAMVEHRVNFVEDKHGAYEELVNLWVMQNDFKRGLEFAERAKSRTLLELLKFQTDTQIEVRASEDASLIAELQKLREEHEQKLRYGQFLLENSNSESQTKALALEQELQSLEEKITDTWHSLLIRNKAYAQDVPLSEVNLDIFQDYLDENTGLIEYFGTNDEFLVFIMCRGDKEVTIQTHRLAVKHFQVERLLQQLNLNFDLVPGREVNPRKDLIRQAQGFLAKLYQMLMLPFETELEKFKKLIIVPHGPLHSVPFHALHDSKKYLIERFQISYLPVASLLKYCRQTRPKTEGALFMGHSFNSKLPFAVEEAKRLASLWGEKAYCEQEACIHFLREEASKYRLIHISCHGDFHSDNSLFSGLVLEDGFLTPLDLFSFRFRSSLVTLSACQTGRSIIGGGDELLGLTRAFLSAGTISLLMTLWPVLDQSTIEWMERFYTLLKQGKTKGEAIQMVQIEFLEGQNHTEAYKHPFFWAPFYLIGEDGML